MLNDLNVAPESILFVDDRAENLEADKIIGMNVVHCADDDQTMNDIISKL